MFMSSTEGNLSEFKTRVQKLSSQFNTTKKTAELVFKTSAGPDDRFEIKMKEFFSHGIAKPSSLSALPSVWYSFVCLVFRVVCSGGDGEASGGQMRIG